MNQLSYAEDNTNCVNSEVKLAKTSNIALLSDQIKKINQFQKPETNKSHWSANKLSDIECDSILKEIEDKKISSALIPEIQTVIDIVNAECGKSSDPEVVVKDVLPFSIEGTDLYFEWDQEGKLIIKNKYTFKPNDYAFQYSSKDIQKGEMELTDKQKQIILSLDTKNTDLLNKPNNKEPKSLPSVGFARKWWGATKDSVLNIASAPETDVYLPMLAYHDRNTYDPEHLKTLNEKAVGIGLGKTITNNQGNSEMIFAMVHLDSHYQVEVDAGYGWQKNYNITDKTKVGVGYAAGVISREDLNNRIPLPFILPMASVTYNKKFTLSGVYIPNMGAINSGAVLFVFGKYTFDRK